MYRSVYFVSLPRWGSFLVRVRSHPGHILSPYPVLYPPIRRIGSISVCFVFFSCFASSHHVILQREPANYINWFCSIFTERARSGKEAVYELTADLYHVHKWRAC
jgi:hypothetical protein